MTPRCEGRYPVPQERAEPFGVTYRCGLHQGHQGPCGSGSTHPSMLDPSPPAPGDAETLEWAERFLAAGARGANGEAGQIIRRLLAESRRLAGEVERLSRDLAEARSERAQLLLHSAEEIGRSTRLAGEVAQLQQQLRDKERSGNLPDSVPDSSSH